MIFDTSNYEYDQKDGGLNKLDLRIQLVNQEPQQLIKNSVQLNSNFETYKIRNLPLVSLEVQLEGFEAVKLIDCLVGAYMAVWFFYITDKLKTNLQVFLGKACSFLILISESPNCEISACLLCGLRCSALKLSYAESADVG